MVYKSLIRSDEKAVGGAARLLNAFSTGELFKFEISNSPIDFAWFFLNGRIFEGTLLCNQTWEQKTGPLLL